MQRLEFECVPAESWSIDRKWFELFMTENYLLVGIISSQLL